MLHETATIPQGSVQRQLVIQLAKNSEVTYSGPIYVDNVTLASREATPPDGGTPGGSTVTYLAKDAVPEGVGVEFLTAPASGDTLYAGEGYVSFFYGEQLGTGTGIAADPVGRLSASSPGYRCDCHAVEASARCRCSGSLEAAARGGRRMVPVGRQGGEPAKQLYRLMYERLTNMHHLNNLIWVWNSENPQWYPGYDVVDIASIDYYGPEGDYKPVSAKYDSLVTLVDDKKIVALAKMVRFPTRSCCKFTMRIGATS